MVQTLEIPDHVESLDDFAQWLRLHGPSPIDEVGTLILDMIEERKDAAEFERDVRGVLIEFGALAVDDSDTSSVDMLAMLLPANPAVLAL